MNKKMSIKKIKSLLKSVRGASVPGKTNDGDRIHIRYKAFRPPTALAFEEAKEAENLELPLDAYTGKLDKIYTSKTGDMIIVMYVELERDFKYRSFNVNKGEIKHLKVLGRG